MSSNVNFSLANFPSGYCFPGVQQYATDLVALLTGTVNTAGKILIGPNAPAPADQDGVWLRTVGGYLEGVYLYLGVWARPHPIPPSSNSRFLYAGADGAADLWLYDGGDGTDPATATLTSGSMWAVDHAFDFKMPIGPGTNGVTYDGNPATIIAQGGTGGEERHKLLATESGVAAHTHDLTQYSLINGSNFNAGGNNDRGGSVTGGVTGGAAPASLSHQNLPPFLGIYFIKRSARQFITH